MKSRTVLYAGIVIVLIAGLIDRLPFDQRSVRTEVAVAGGNSRSGWTLFGGIGSTDSMAVQQAAPVTVESLENAQDFYASFLAARATARPEMIYEAKTLLEGCESGFMQISMMQAAIAANQPDPTKDNPALVANQQKRGAAIEELNRKCRGFAVVRDWRALQKELWQEASSGDGPLAQLLRAEGYLGHFEAWEVKDAIAEGLKSGDRTTIELAIRSLWGSLFDPRRYGPDHSAGYLPLLALNQASRNVFGENGLRQADTQFRKLYVCALAVCDSPPDVSWDSSEGPTEKQDLQDYYELVSLYENALARADVDAIMYARPSHFDSEYEVGVGPPFPLPENH